MEDKKKEKGGMKTGGTLRPPSSLMDRKMFILDTNVFLHDSKAIFSFEGAIIGIPFVVLEELDTFKKERNELGASARAVIRVLDELRHKGSLQQGVEISESSGTYVVVLPPPKPRNEIFCTDEADNLIVSTILEWQEAGWKITFITKDINLRIKSDALGIEAEDYTKGTVSAKRYFKGWRKYEASNFDIKKVNEENVASFIGNDAKELAANEYVVLQGVHSEWVTKIFRHLGSGKFREIHEQKLFDTFVPLNFQQLIAMDLLLDDTVQFVSLVGPAGTGKTFITLLTGLHKILRERKYRKFLISRPTIALGADIGFLPGDLDEKLFHWMQPIYDNLEVIFSQIEQPLVGKKKYSRRKFAIGTAPQIDEINRLKEMGILSLEAITYMRGRSIPNQFVLIDEVQNLTPHEVKTIVSRAGQGTKIIISGDPYQIDSPYLDFTSNGLTVTTEKFKGQKIFGTAFLETSERSELASLAASLL